MSQRTEKSSIQYSDSVPGTARTKVGKHDRATRRGQNPGPGGCWFPGKGDHIPGPLLPVVTATLTAGQALQPPSWKRALMGRGVASRGGASGGAGGTQGRRAARPGAGSRVPGRGLVLQVAPGTDRTQSRSAARPGRARRRLGTVAESRSPEGLANSTAFCFVRFYFHGATIQLYTGMSRGLLLPAIPASPPACSPTAQLRPSKQEAWEAETTLALVQS
ncbi:uncharacterized protein LOC109435217 [Rhinolophus sinicus]|uniref:uncharacterized protein LOC109435217 n=1 Tax=Rhinolophus sinicus TaxID=89399 RepID=UPI003D7B9E6E